MIKPEALSKKQLLVGAGSDSAPYLVYKHIRRSQINRSLLGLQLESKCVDSPLGQANPTRAAVKKTYNMCIAA